MRLKSILIIIIIASPWNDLTILEIDPSNNTTSAFGRFAGGSKTEGGILAPNGKIYGIPMIFTSVIVIDPKSNGTWPSDLYLSPYFNKY